MAFLSFHYHGGAGGSGVEFLNNYNDTVGTVGTRRAIHEAVPFFKVDFFRFLMMHPFVHLRSILSRLYIPVKQSS